MDTELIKDILFEVRSLPKDEQAAFIDERCGGDKHIAERVHALLAADGRASGRLLAGAGDERPRQPERIAGRAVERLLGEGGFGLVYLARESDPIERQVAIKLLRPGFEGGSVLARFEAERRVLALMSHPGIAQVFDAGATEDGRPYVVMEYVDGPTISEYCAERQLSIRQRVALVERVCRAVQHAHQRGVIHRDIKPSNVLVSTASEEPIPKVIDFGIAKAFGDATGGDQGLTRTINALGTPQYMAPEQALRADAGVDTRADVYGLGAVLFTCLTGQAPFEANRFLPRAGATRIDHTPPRPSAVAAHSGGASLSRTLTGELDWIVTRAMAEDPDRRYQSALKLADDLRRWLDGRAVEAGPESTLYRTRKLASRHPTAFIGAACALVVIVAAAIVSTVYATVADAARAEAVRQERETARELVKYEAMTDFTRRMLRGITPDVARRMDTALLERMLTDAVADLDADPPGDAEVRGTLRLMIATVHVDIGQLDRAIGLAEDALQEVESTLGREHPETMTALGALGAMYAQAGRLDDARGVLAEVLAFRVEQSGPGDSETLTVRANLAGIDHRRGAYRQAAESYTHVHAAYASKYGEDDPRTLRHLGNLAMSTARLDKREEAISMLRRVVEANEARGDPDSPQAIMARSNMALFYSELGQTALAREEYEKALEIQREMLPYGHPSTLTTMINLGDLLRNARQHEAAAEMFEEALRRGESGLPSNDIRLYYIRMGLGMTLRATGRASEAAEVFARAVEVGRSLRGDNDPMTLRAESEHAHALAASGEFDEARRLAKSAVERARAVAASRPADLLHILSNAGMVEYFANDRERELVLLIERYGVSEASRGADHPASRQLAGYIRNVCRELGLDADAAMWDALAKP